jgi:ergothioneine biosynthesis protein EgtB
MDIIEQYKKLRTKTETICESLQIEDYVVQPIPDVSPPKWHLGHTTWFFETFLLKPYAEGYIEFDPAFDFVFNSYYETIGNRVIRTDRGNLSRPTVSEIYLYRAAVDKAMEKFLSSVHTKEIKELILLGFNHEEQHQELLLTDIKYILGHNPLFPEYQEHFNETEPEAGSSEMIPMEEGIYEIGYSGSEFCFDNELGKHKVYLNEFHICSTLVTNEEYLEFINDGGYTNFSFWHAAGWDWVKKENVKSPLYWHLISEKIRSYTLSGLKPLQLKAPVSHISYYEAYAYANWKGMRLATEFEWEASSKLFHWGNLWEWTESAYLPYPHYSKAPGAIGEYNGKFMVGQQILRGASIATSEYHSRNTYRNFFPYTTRWQYTGIRLAY